MHVARQPVELGNNQLRLVLAAEGERFGELGVVVLLAAFNLGEFLADLAAAIDKGGDGLTLGIEA
ncbi:MAG TPA: hypothetical protein PKE45_21125, partial [Caldilineaceae bacterium]|nr:hypothetical protein [Caldilineaceae bacterium]